MVLLDTWERKNCAASIVETKLSAFSTIGKQSFCFQQTRAITTPLGLSTFILVCFFPPLVTFSLYGRVRGLFQLSILQPLLVGLIILIIVPFLSNSFSCLCDYKHSQAQVLTQLFWDNTATIFPLPSVTPSTCKGHGLQISSVNFLSLVSQLLEACWLPTYLQLSNLLEK